MDLLLRSSPSWIPCTPNVNSWCLSRGSFLVFVANFSTFGVKFLAWRCVGVGVKMDKYEVGYAQTVNRLYRSTHSLSPLLRRREISWPQPWLHSGWVWQVCPHLFDKFHLQEPNIFLPLPVKIVYRCGRRTTAIVNISCFTKSLARQNHRIPPAALWMFDCRFIVLVLV